ncbi:MAG: hypothetical protein ACR2KG_04530 [Nocardioidaceae bacterium]
MSESFVPLQQAEFSGDRLTVPYDKSKVKDAPNVSGDTHLSPDGECGLYDYYGVDYGAGYTGTNSAETPTSPKRSTRSC